MIFVLQLSILLLFVRVSVQQDIRNVSLKILYKSDAILFCGNSTNLNESLWPNVSFYRQSGSRVNQIVPDNVKFIFNSTNNTLIIKSLRRPDIESTYFCNSTNNIQINYINQIWPFLYMPNERKIGPLAGTTTKIECTLLYGNEDKLNNISWIWRFGNVTINATNRIFIKNKFSPFIESALTIKDIYYSQRGNYECQAYNKFGMANRYIRVSVKSSLAPVWPFIGVIIEIAIMAVILRYADKKEKA